MTRGDSSAPRVPVLRVGLGGWVLTHGAILILNAVAAAQLVMTGLTGQLGALPPFGFILLIDGIYLAVALRRGLSGGRDV